MLKRFGLFLLTNLLVIITVGVILSFLMPALGINPAGLTGLLVFCSIFGMTGAFISLAISRWMAKRAYGIKLISRDERDSNLRTLYDMVASLSKRAGLPAVPEVGVYNSPDPNAFATGPSKKKSLVAFSTGLLDSMDRAEVEAVAAHEISHIANGDMVTMTLLQGIANALVMFLARVVTWALDQYLSDGEGGGLGYIARIALTIVLEMVFMLLASIPLSWFSRQREYRADAGAAKLSSAQSMIGALESLGRSVLPGAVNRKDSFSMAKINSKRRISLFSTHPALEDRIAALRKMG